MRRMYSEKELSVLVYQAVGQYIEDGAFDEITAESVDAYLEEHPVDITALEGQTIAPAVVNATTSISAPAITGDSIIENMSGYSFEPETASQDATLEFVYVGAVKNGNKLTLVIACNVTPTASTTQIGLGKIVVPNSVYSRLYDTRVGDYNFLDNKKIAVFDNYYTSQDVLAYMQKSSGKLVAVLRNTNVLTTNTKYYCRYEVTFLLSDNLAS